MFVRFWMSERGLREDEEGAALAILRRLVSNLGLRRLILVFTALAIEHCKHKMSVLLHFSIYQYKARADRHTPSTAVCQTILVFFSQDNIILS